MNALKWLGVLTLLLPNIPTCFAQIVTLNSADVIFTNGSIVTSNGGFVIGNGTNYTNNGDLNVTKNSTLPAAGNFILDAGANVNGSGLYSIEQNWINNGSFFAENSTVNLYGNTEQLISSTNGTVTEFNNLNLLGIGTGINRRKSLQGADARVSTTGILQLNDRELATQTNLFSVLNTTNLAILNDLTFGNEGFVSSEPPGMLAWSTNSTNNYYFPVGSSNGTQRYRPVSIRPEANANNTFRVRLDNTSADTYSYFLAQHDNSISQANTSFFHSIEQVAGNSNVDLRIAYNPIDDGEWGTIGHWKANQDLWVSIGPANQNGLGNYSSLEKVNWDFPDAYIPYVLANSEELLIIPNVFTPNNDNMNDLYTVTGKGVTDYSIVIVNRWGNPVFESDDLNTSWDGTFNGEPCQDGVYFYIIRGKSGTEEFVKQGHITLYNN